MTKETWSGFAGAVAGVISMRKGEAIGAVGSSRPSRFRVLALAVPAVVVMLMAIPPASAGIMSPTARSSPATYAIAEPVCKPPTPGHSSCFAMRIVLVKKATPGARLYEPFALAGAGSVTSGPKATIGPTGGLTPSDLAKAYGFSSTAPVASQTVAIVDAFNNPNIDSDLQFFDAHYGLSACSEADGCLRVVGQTGTSVLPPNDTAGWSEEESLDVETVHSVCQRCHILLLEANSSSNADLAAAVREAVALKATEVSNSYGSPEAGSTSTEEAAYNHPGTVITASSGDDGYDSFDLLGVNGIVNQPDEPASFNTVVAVGGTSLYLGQSATRQSETVWNDNGVQDVWEGSFGQPLGAGGGGCSTLVRAEAWQTHLTDWASTDCHTHRAVADISADADPFTGFDIYDTFDCGVLCGTPGWSTAGGTSLASPIIAAMFGLAGGSHGVAYPALTLYGHLGSPSLYDVTSGGNGYCDGEGAAACGDPNTIGVGVLDCDYPASGTTPNTGDRICDALPGYDGPSGVGTPNGLGAFAKTGPSATIAGPRSVVAHRTDNWTASAKDPFPGGVVTSYKWNWGDGSAATLTRTAKAAHGFVRAGVTHTITLTVTDNYGQTVVVTWPVKVT